MCPQFFFVKLGYYADIVYMPVGTLLSFFHVFNFRIRARGPLSIERSASIRQICGEETVRRAKRGKASLLYSLGKG